MQNATQTTLNVAGMNCGSCVKHITSALNELAGVCEIEVKLREREVRVRHEADKVSSGEIVLALAKAGYEASPRS